MNTNKYIVYVAGMQPTGVAADRVDESETWLLFENVEQTETESKVTISAQFKLQNVVGYIDTAHLLVPLDSEKRPTPPSRKRH